MSLHFCRTHLKHYFLSDGISDSRQRASRMLKSIRLTNHTDCRAEPHMFGLHWIDLAPLANLTSLPTSRSRRCRRSLAESHRHQDVQEWSGDLDDSRAHLIDQVEIDLVLRYIPQRSHQKLRIKRDRKLASLIHHRQRFLGFTHFRRIRYDVDITFRKDQFHRVRLFARQKRYSANGGKESRPFEGDPFLRLGRNHLAIIGVIPFDQLGSKQGSVQLKWGFFDYRPENHHSRLRQPGHA